MDFPERRLTDPAELRVLAHPLRLRLLQALVEAGTATATDLGAVVGESPANCSWHLRQLAKHGFVAETDAPGRRRPWRPVAQWLTWDSGASGPIAAAAHELNVALQEEEFAALRAWQVWCRAESQEWRDAAEAVQGAAWLTAEELAEFSRELAELVRRHMDRVADPSLRPPGARRVRIFGWAVPAVSPASGE